MIITMINDLGVNPNEWFDDEPHPHDSMPIANGTNRYAPSEKMIELESHLEETNPRPEEEIADWFDESDEIEHEKTLHHKMYEIATSKYNPFSVGGSESIHDFEGGSENVMS